MRRGSVSGAQALDLSLRSRHLREGTSGSRAEAPTRFGRGGSVTMFSWEDSIGPLCLPGSGQSSPGSPTRAQSASNAPADHP